MDNVKNDSYTYKWVFFFSFFGKKKILKVPAVILRHAGHCLRVIKCLLSLLPTNQSEGLTDDPHSRGGRLEDILRVFQRGSDNLPMECFTSMPFVFGSFHPEPRFSFLMVS